LILLDTHVLAWLASDPGKLSRPAASAIRRAYRVEGVAISAMSLWELGWLVTHGRVQMPGTPESILEKASSRTAVLPVSSKIAALANQFPMDFPSDPCDRLIGATALAEGMTLITKDERIRACKLLRTVW
jgi:PIN domain nuclease of toxin-antitoxin system